MNLRKIIAVLAGLAAFAAVSPAHAQYATLTPGGMVSPIASLTATQAFAGSTFYASLDNQVTVPSVVGTLDPAGNVTTDVYKLNNGSGFIFAYTINANAGNNDTFTSLKAFNFSGLSTQVGYTSNATSTGTKNTTPGVAPDSATRTNKGTGPNSVVFNITSGVGAGSSSQTLLIRTNAGGIIQTSTNQVTDGISSTFTSYSPDGTIAPEPASFAVFGIVGLGVLGLMVRARRGKTQLAA